MSLACKFEEIYAPEIKDWVYMCDKAYTNDDVREMEALITDAIRWRTAVPTAHTFAKRFANCACGLDLHRGADGARDAGEEVGTQQQGRAMDEQRGATEDKEEEEEEEAAEDEVDEVDGEAMEQEWEAISMGDGEQEGEEEGGQEEELEDGEEEDEDGQEEQEERKEGEAGGGGAGGAAGGCAGETALRALIAYATELTLPQCYMHALPQQPRLDLVQCALLAYGVLTVLHRLPSAHSHTLALWGF